MKALTIEKRRSTMYYKKGDEQYEFFYQTDG